MLNNCHVCWWAGVPREREGEEDPGDLCPPLSPKATKSLGDWGLPFPPCLCRCSLVRRTDKGSPQIRLPACTCLRAGPRRDPRGALKCACGTVPIVSLQGPSSFFFFLFFFFLIISQMSPPSAETISRLYVFIIFLTLHYSLLPIPLLL